MQTYSNHARYVPLYHFIASPILIANAVNAIWRLKYGIYGGSVLYAATAVALVLIGWYARAFAVRVQDRVIRLEMRLRLREVLPAAMQSQIANLSMGQLVGLRFASDAELPELVATTLKDNLGGRDIKKLVKNWVPDEARA